jgi:hypothetical protein
MPAIFEKNGVPVKKIQVEPLPIKYQRIEGGDISLPLLDQIKTSHALVLIADKFVFQTPCGPDSGAWVDFDARLWDLNKKRPVWSASPRLFLTIKQPLLRSQQFAGSLLNSMQKDGIVNLKNDSGPIDLDGKTISGPSPWSDDK